MNEIVLLMLAVLPTGLLLLSLYVRARWFRTRHFASAHHHEICPWSGCPLQEDGP